MPGQHATRALENQRAADIDALVRTVHPMEWWSCSRFFSNLRVIPVPQTAVTGDKTNHVAGVHLPQVFYLCSSLACFAMPHFVGWLVNYSRAIIKGDRAFSGAMCFAVVAGVVVHFNTVIHPFTLADNRHYVFYIFRYLFRSHPLVRYALAPFYVLAALFVKDQFASVGRRDHYSEERRSVEQEGIKQSESYQVSYESNSLSLWICLCLSGILSIVTAPLVEPRYFILPFIFWRLHLIEPSSPPESSGTSWFRRHRLWLETAWLLLINALTMYVFLYRGFRWAHEPDQIQRFLW